MMHKAWSSIEEVPYCFSKSSVKYQGHTALKIVEFDPNWAFPDCNSSLISPMATKWCTMLELVSKRCPISFQGHPSNFEVTRLKKPSNLTQIGRFRTVTHVWIHQWLRNDAQSLKFNRRVALLFFKVIRQILRSHGSKNRRFWPKLAVSGLCLQFGFTNGYEMMHKAWSSIEEVPYCFSRSYIKLQGHTALKIVDFDPNWAFPDCISSLKSLMATK